MSCANCNCEQCKFDRRLKEIKEELERKMARVRNETYQSI